jgi:hypothetical protein
MYTGGIEAILMKSKKKKRSCLQELRVESEIEEGKGGAVTSSNQQIGKTTFSRK